MEEGEERVVVAPDYAAIAPTAHRMLAVLRDDVMAGRLTVGDGLRAAASAYAMNFACSVVPGDDAALLAGLLGEIGGMVKLLRERGVGMEGGNGSQAFG